MIGLGDGENFLGSDVAAFVEHTRKALAIGQDQIVSITPDAVTVTDFAGTPVTAEPFDVFLVAADGSEIVFGPGDAAQRVTGSLEDFCRLATQRVNLVDTDLVATGTDAQRWLDLTQAFAGMPGKGRD